MSITLDCRIESVGLDDLDGILNVELECHPAEPMPRAFFESALEQPNTHGIVARHSDETVGFAIYSMLSSSAVQVSNLAVRPKWQRRGVARKMLSPFAGKDIYAWVCEDSFKAQIVLARLAFRAVRLDRNRYGGRDAYLFRRSPGRLVFQSHTKRVVI